MCRCIVCRIELLVPVIISVTVVIVASNMIMLPTVTALFLFDTHSIVLNMPSNLLPLCFRLHRFSITNINCWRVFLHLFCGFGYSTSVNVSFYC